ncbi:MAG: DUF5789 family protein [Halobacteriales archaeon]
MAEDTEEEQDEEAEGPAVELGEAPAVEGAPIARVASRLTWPIERSEIDRKEGDTEIRTPDGPMALSTVLEDVETSYFDGRQEFVHAVEAVIGTGPVPTVEE